MKGLRWRDHLNYSSHKKSHEFDPLCHDCTRSFNGNVCKAENFFCKYEHIEWGLQGCQIALQNKEAESRVLKITQGKMLCSKNSAMMVWQQNREKTTRKLPLSALMERPPPPLKNNPNCPDLTQSFFKLLSWGWRLSNPCCKFSVFKSRKEICFSWATSQCYFMLYSFQYFLKCLERLGMNSTTEM